MKFTMLYALKTRYEGYADATKPERLWYDIVNILPILLILLFCIALIVIVLIVKYKKEPTPKEPKYVYFRNGDSLTKLECDNTKPLLLPYPKREGYTFGGWFLDSACTVPYVSTKRLQPNTILYAKWLKEG